MTIPFQELGALVLGWYDFDKVNVPMRTSSDVHIYRMVQVHEQMHQLLNQSSSFGMILDRLGRLARKDVPRAASLLEQYIDVSRTAHEVAATYLGIELSPERDLRGTLDEEYSAYFEMAERIVRYIPESRYWRTVVVARVVQSALLTQWKDSIGRGHSSDDEFVEMASEYITVSENSPDLRLSVLLSRADVLSTSVMIEAMERAGCARAVCLAFANLKSPRAILESLLLEDRYWTQLFIDFELSLHQVVDAWAETCLPDLAETRSEVFNARLIEQTASALMTQMSALLTHDRPARGVESGSSVAARPGRLNKTELEKYLPSQRRGSDFFGMFVEHMNTKPELVASVDVHLDSGRSMSIADFLGPIGGYQVGNRDLLFHFRRAANQRLLTGIHEASSFQLVDSLTPQPDLAIRHHLLLVEDSHEGCRMLGTWQLRDHEGRIQAVPERPPRAIADQCSISICENRHDSRRWDNLRNQFDPSMGLVFLLVEENLIDFCESLVQSNGRAKWFCRQKEFDRSVSVWLFLFFSETWNQPFLAFCNRDVYGAVRGYVDEYLESSAQLVELSDADASELLGAADLAALWAHPALQIYCQGKVIRDHLD